MKILENVPLAGFTTFKVGGNARYFCVIENEADLVEFLKNRAIKLPIFVLGGGSNVLVSDDGFPGIVLKMNMKGVKVKNLDRGGVFGVGVVSDDGAVLVTAAAGEVWDEFVKETVARGFWGIENLSGIPGIVGAAPVGNIGAYGTEICDVVESVRAVHTATGAFRTFMASECQFGYRDSFFKTPEGKNYIVTSVTFRLRTNPKPNLSYKDLANYFEKRSEGLSLEGLRRREAWWRQGLSLTPERRGRTRPPAGAGECARKRQSFTPSLSQIRQAVLEIRAEKFPDLSKIGTAGSFWKNPVVSRADFEILKTKYPEMPSFDAPKGVKIPLAWILDKICGLKGCKSSSGADGAPSAPTDRSSAPPHTPSAQLFEKQPLVMIAERGVTQKEISSFAKTIAKKVQDKTGIKIEPEVVFL